MLYGLMTEEINHSYEGGLYPDLVRNRTMHSDSDKPVHWSAVVGSGAQASIVIDKTTGPSQALPISLKLTIEEADSSHLAGVENEGFWGMAVRPNTTYKGSFYARGGEPSVGPLTISLRNDYTGKTAASATVETSGTEWKRYTFELKTAGVETSSANHLVMTAGHPGTIWLDLVSLFPPTYHDRPDGDRIDLMEKMAAMHPAFLRLPGGNYLEGDYINERFDWKKTIGPLVDRPGHRSPWNYWSTDAMGLLEFLDWCEDLHMQPLLAVYAGYSLKGEHVEPGAALQPYVDDALDEIEYVTGGKDTKWGAERAQDGHPAPFHLQYVEIGNEDWFDKSGSYDGRFAQFFDAIKKKYPQLQLIATTPVKSRTPDVIDDHFYRRAEQFFNDTHHYDKTSRTGPKIFVGEWATREGSPTPNMNAALGDAAWMTGLERNSDIVIMASYAPLLVNVDPGAMQWATDLIGFNTLTAYGSPSYYAQVMFGQHLGNEIIPAKLDGAGTRLFYSVTKHSDSGVLEVKIVNAASTPQPLNFQVQGVHIAGDKLKWTSLSATNPRDTNTITAPTRIVPVERTISVGKMTVSAGTVQMNPVFIPPTTFAPYSINVLEIPTK